VNAPADPLLRLRGATVWPPDTAPVLADVDLDVHPGQHWALLGPNGAGKSTLLSLAGGMRHPSRGEVWVLGRRLGAVELRELRADVGVVDARLRVPRLSVHDYVLTGVSGTVQPLPDRYGPAEHDRAAALLERVGMAALADRDVTTCSAGEMGRARIARALMPRPLLLLLDEPASGLDLPGREALVDAVTSLVHDHPELATVLVAHHLEDLPPTTTHAVLLRHGHVVATGPADEVLTEGPLSQCFGLPLEVSRHEGTYGDRWAARARRVG
jgi:iron complex transport system ATP-binding protein